MKHALYALIIGGFFTFVPSAYSMLIVPKRCISLAPCCSSHIQKRCFFKQFLHTLRDKSYDISSLEFIKFEIHQVTGPNCFNAYTQRKICCNEQCVKHIPTMSLREFENKRAQKKQIAFLDTIENPYQLLSDIERKYKKLCALEHEVIKMATEKHHSNLEQFQLTLDLIQHIKNCLHNKFQIIEKNQLYCYERQEKMYLEKLQEEQKRIRNLAILYQNKLIIEKETMDVAIIRLQEIFCQNQRRQYVDHKDLYKQSIQLLSSKE